MAESVYFTSLQIKNLRCFGDGPEGDGQPLNLTSDGKRPPDNTRGLVTLSDGQSCPIRFTTASPSTDKSRNTPGDF